MVDYNDLHIGKQEIARANFVGVIKVDGKGYYSDGAFSKDGIVYSHDGKRAAVFTSFDDIISTIMWLRDNTKTPAYDIELVKNRYARSCEVYIDIITR